MKKISITYNCYCGGKTITKTINHSISHYISAFYKVYSMKKIGASPSYFFNSFKRFINHELHQVLVFKQTVSKKDIKQLFNCLHAFGYFIFRDLFQNSNPIKNQSIKNRFVLCDNNHSMSFHFDAKTSNYIYKYGGKHCKVSFSYNPSTYSINIKNNSFIIDVYDPISEKKDIDYESMCKEYEKCCKTFADYLKTIEKLTIFDDNDIGIKIVLSTKPEELECDDIYELDGFYICVFTEDKLQSNIPLESFD